MRRRLIRLCGLILAGLLVAWSMGAFESELTDEDQIRAAIEQIADGAEGADMNRVMEPFSAQYSDAEGLDRRGIYGIFWSQFRKRGPITVWLSAIDVQVTGNQAWASFDAGLAEGTEGQLIGWPVNVDALTFEVAFEREPEGWRVTQHTRRPAWEIDNPTNGGSQP